MSKQIRAKLIQFIDSISLDCSANQNALVQKAKDSEVYGVLDWDSAFWDISIAMERRKRGHKTSRRRECIHFTQHRSKGQQVGLAMQEPFASILKAMVSLRYMYGGQGTNSQMVFIRAARYIYQVLGSDPSFTNINPQVLNDAALAASKKEAETSFYKLVCHLEELASLVDKHKLSKHTLDWQCKIKKRPAQLSDDRLEDAVSIQTRHEKLPSNEAIKAIGTLYLQIPKVIDDKAADDRLRILAVSLLALTGLRIGELLTLEAQPVQIDDKGQHYLYYYPQKLSKGNVILKRSKKYLLTATKDLVVEIINEILERTQAARKVALDWFKHQQPPGFKDFDNRVPLSKIIKFGFKIETLKVRLQANMPKEPELSQKGIDKQILTKTFKEDHIGGPILQSGKLSIALHQALFVVCHNQMTGQKQTLMHAARPLNEQHIADFLKGRSSKRGTTLSIFEKYQLFEDAKEPFRLRSHGFRHFLNNLLDEGGAPDLIQTEWFGRKHKEDTAAYQHMSPVQRALKFKEDFKDGLIEGPLVKSIKNIPASYQDAFIEARIQAVHDVKLGFCTHDFSQHPCPKHLQCSANCSDLHWLKKDNGQAEELNRSYALNMLAHKTAKEATAEKYWGADQWLIYNEKILAQQRSQMKSMGITQPELDKLTAKLETT